MITDKNIDNLYRITSNLALKDFKQMNPKPKMNSKGFTNFKPYSLSDDTKEALNLLKIAQKPQQDITQNEEEQIKAYLLKIKLVYPELIEQTNGNYEQWKAAKQ